MEKVQRIMRAEELETADTLQESRSTSSLRRAISCMRLPWQSLSFASECPKGRIGAAMCKMGEKALLFGGRNLFEGVYFDDVWALSKKNVAGDRNMKLQWSRCVHSFRAIGGRRQCYNFALAISSALIFLFTGYIRQDHSNAANVQDIHSLLLAECL